MSIQLEETGMSNPFVFQRCPEKCDSKSDINTETINNVCSGKNFNFGEHTGLVINYHMSVQLSKDRKM